MTIVQRAFDLTQARLSRRGVFPTLAAALVAFLTIRRPGRAAAVATAEPEPEPEAAPFVVCRVTYLHAAALQLGEMIAAHGDFESRVMGARRGRDAARDGRGEARSKSDREYDEYLDDLIVNRMAESRRGTRDALRCEMRARGVHAVRAGDRLFLDRDRAPAGWERHDGGDGEPTVIDLTA